MVQSSDFKIAIIGAGPAGCTLGRILSLSNIPFTIFESESSPKSRTQGGTLDLHERTGLAAVKAAGLHEEFLKHARFDGEALIIADKKMLRYLDMGGTTASSSDGRPEIDRRQLRSILLESLPEESIQWGRRLRHVTEDLTLHFDEGEEKGFDLIVGAEGAWSKTRQVITDQVPFYTGVCGTEFRITDAENRYPDLHRFVNKGSLFSYGDGRSITAQQIGDGSIKVTEWGARDENWAKENNASQVNAKALKARFAEEYADWAPELQKLIAVADDEEVISRSLFMLPIGIRWQNKPGVTLIGDAAHLMSPFAGEGANLAMADAMKLAECIRKSRSKKELTTNVALFEEEMFKRAKPIQHLSYVNMTDWFFTEGSPRTVIERFVVREIKQLKGSLIGVLAAVWIYIHFWWFKQRNN